MKKKTLKQICATVMTGALAMSLMACGGSDTTGTPAADESEPVQAETDTDSDAEVTGGGYEEEAAPALPEAKDLGGRTIKIGLWWDEFYDSEYQSLEDITAAGGSYDNAETAQMKLDAVRQVEERWNCKIDYVNLGWQGTIDSIGTSVTNGTPDCDIYLSDLQFGIAPVINGYAQKLSDIAPADSDVLNDQIVFTRFSVLGNDDYLFYNSSTIPGAATYLAYNASMLDELGLEAPEALAQKGEWTWDKFADYCSQLTRDTDGDGNMDVYGYGSTSNRTISGFLASNNAQIAVSATEGLSDSKTVETFNYIDRLYNVDGTARPYTDDWADQEDALFQNKVAFAFVNDYQLRDRDIDYAVRICPAPTGPSGDGSMTPVQLNNCYFIPVGVEDAASVYQVFEELNNWYDFDTSYRDDPTAFESEFEDEEQLELAYTEGSKANEDIWSNVINCPVNDVFWAVIVDKEMSVSQAVESYKQQMQDALDAMTANIG